MKKRFKGLVSIWLVAILLIGMLPMTALAEEGGQTENTPEPDPNAWMWTGTVPLREASEDELNSGLFIESADVYIEPGRPLNEQRLAAIPEGTDLLSWVRWGLMDSGFVSVFPTVEYPANHAVSESDLDGAYIFEPVFSNVQITAVNNFTPAVKVYAASDDTPPYDWRTVEAYEGLGYQWYKQTQTEISYYFPYQGVSPTGEAMELQRFVSVLVGNNSNGTPTSEDGLLLLTLELKSGDTLTVTPKGTDDVSIFRILGSSVGIVSGFTEDAGTYRVTNDTSVAATYVVGILSDSGEPVTATVDVTAAVRLDDRTSASLLTAHADAAPLTEGSYLCMVSYDSDSSNEYNHVYTAWCDPVEYSGNAKADQAAPTGLGKI